ncbi:MAG: glycerol-3-phosphate dehydrogenase [Alphaproteobacteria bacterium]|nr:glycerol-3-phosphate dehydrogenase [Alphaproteobacteria bacterium]
MAEGSLEAPTRLPVPWQNPDFHDEAMLDEELRRVFDICHGCRRCFNLCDSFPRLFDLIDRSESGELDTVESKDFKPVVDACTLCDMCFMTKCPYVPPHEFNLDFPHLMLRYRSLENAQKKLSWADRQLTETDRNGKLAKPFAGLCNWASNEKNTLTRPLMETALGVHREARLPRYHGTTFTDRAGDVPDVNTKAPAHGRKAVLYATCFSNYNDPEIGIAARKVLARNGVETEVVYPSCCGMPQFEQGDIARVAEAAAKVAAEMRAWVDKGYAIIALVPSCALMLKFEWPLIVPDDDNVKALSTATRDIDEYIVDIAKTEGLAEGLAPLDGGVVLHIACHARAQNIGQKSTELLKLIPGNDLKVIERCSGHGGSWGIKKENFEVGLKIGKPVARQARSAAKPYVASGCPLAADHILQGMERIEGDAPVPARAHHPVQIFAKAYGL